MSLLADVASADVFAPFFIGFKGAKQCHLAAVSDGGSITTACRMVIMESSSLKIDRASNRPIHRDFCPVCKRAVKKFCDKMYGGQKPASK